jgi:hypothetical protein
MNYALAIVCAVLLCACASTARETENERTVEREVTTKTTKGTQAGQPVDVTEKKTTHKEKITERELAREEMSKPDVPVGDIGGALLNLATGNWTAVVASLAALLAGKVAGRIGAEKAKDGEIREITEGVQEFARADPVAGAKLGDQLSKAMSKKTKQTVRRVKP